jgi:ABC-type nitrate/sulfonate/bicarbonate transport system permease component
VATFRHIYVGASLGMLLCALTLVVAEFIAAFNRTKGDTITDTIRVLNLPPVVWWMFVGTLIVFLTWFLAHVITEQV